MSVGSFTDAITVSMCQPASFENCWIVAVLPVPGSPHSTIGTLAESSTCIAVNVSSICVVIGVVLVFGCLHCQATSAVLERSASGPCVDSSNELRRPLLESLKSPQMSPTP